MSARQPFIRAGFGALAIFAALLLVGALYPGTWLLDTLTGLFASGLLVMSLHLLVGYTGLISFGHAAYFASGGYIFGMLLQAPAFIAALGGWSVPSAVLLALLGTALFSLVVGLICARLSAGISSSIAARPASFRSAASTCAPCSANMRVATRPIPLAAPVTRIVLFASRIASSVLL